MKKRLFSFLMIFVLLLGIMPAASADYMSLNSAVAGERLDMIIKQNEYSLRRLHGRFHPERLRHRDGAS